MKTIPTIAILLALSLSACHKHPEQVSKEQYLPVLKADHEAIYQEKKFKGITFSFRYCPIEEVVLNDCGDCTLTDSVYRKLFDKHKELQYYTLTLVSDDENEILEHYSNESDEAYYQMLDYLENGIQDDIYLLQGTDTLPCVISHYERNFGLSANNKVSLAFKNTEPQRPFLHDKILVYNDRLFNTGELRFKISKESLNKLPELAYEK